MFIFVPFKSSQVHDTSMEHKLMYLLLSFVNLPKVMISLKVGQKKKKKRPIKVVSLWWCITCQETVFFLKGLNFPKIKDLQKPKKRLKEVKWIFFFYLVKLSKQQQGTFFLSRPSAAKWTDFHGGVGGQRRGILQNYSRRTKI